MVGIPAPSNVDPGERIFWQIQKVTDLGGQITGVGAWQLDDDTLKHVRDSADEKGVELESYVGGVFSLIGPEAEASLSQLKRGLDAALMLGGPIVRCGYGRLQIASSRFNKEISLEAHLDQIAANLREAAKVAEDRGVIIAVENHCDFTGRELAGVIQTIDSPAIRAALDTGNSFTVFADPMDDLEALAPLAVTTHLKDMKVVQHNEPGRVPFLPVGCALGEGHVDIVATVRLLAERSPRGRDMPLIVETGWVPRSPDRDHAEQLDEIFRASVQFLRENVAEYLKV